VAAVSTPTPRELYVEHLVSQNRNAVISFSGPTTVELGQTVTYTVTTKTATQGYEQLEGFSTFPTSIFRIVSTATTYSAPTGATNDTLYADACGWDAAPASGTYRSCVGPEGYTGGKAGGNPITTTYTLEVVGTGTGNVQTLIYDFSGSSYHYNSDFGTAITVTSSAADADLGVGVADSPDPVGLSGALVYTVGVANAGPDPASAVVLTVNLPAGVVFVSAVGSGWSCGQAAGVVTCSRPSLASGASAPDVTIDVTAPSTAGTVTLTASVDSATADSNAANDADSEDTTVTAVNAPPDAVDDSASTSAGSAIGVSVLGNDTDGDGDPLTITANSSPANGTASCASVCTYTPNPGFAGTDTFTYTISDGRGGADTGIVTITVSGASGGGSVNSPPSAADDSATTTAGTPVTIPVLSNDVDPDGGSLTIASHTQPSSGTAFCSAVACTYSPAAGSYGAVTFTYVVSDGNGGTDTAIVTVNVSPGAGSSAGGSGGQDISSGKARAGVKEQGEVARKRPAKRIARKRRAKPHPVLTAAKTSAAGRVAAGDVIAYRIVIRNTGRVVVRDILVCDVPSDRLTFVAAPSARFVRGQACWRIVSLAPGARAVFGVEARADTTAAGPVVNLLTVGAGGIRNRVRSRAVVGVKARRADARAGGVTG
jgi:uncharacterized repeat protein (TIGR01451 family)